MNSIKKLIADDQLAEAIDLIEKNGVNVVAYRMLLSQANNIEHTVLKENRQYTEQEWKRRINILDGLRWELINEANKI